MSINREWDFNEKFVLSDNKLCFLRFNTCAAWRKFATKALAAEAIKRLTAKRRKEEKKERRKEGKKEKRKEEKKRRKKIQS